jgi:hypothetical protein
MNPNYTSERDYDNSPLNEAIVTDRPQGGSLFSVREKVVLLGKNK